MSALRRKTQRSGAESSHHGRKRFNVALSVDANRWIREEAQSRGWRLMHFCYSENRIPAGVILILQCVQRQALLQREGLGESPVGATGRTQ